MLTIASNLRLSKPLGKASPARLAKETSSVGAPAPSDSVQLGQVAEKPVQAKPAAAKQPAHSGLVTALSGAALLGGLGLVAAAAAPILGPTLGAVAGGGVLAMGEWSDKTAIRGLGMAALGGALLASGVSLLGAIPLALGVGVLAIAGLSFRK